MLLRFVSVRGASAGVRRMQCWRLECKHGSTHTTSWRWGHKLRVPVTVPVYLSVSMPLAVVLPMSVSASLFVPVFVHVSSHA